MEERIKWNTDPSRRESVRRAERARARANPELSRLKKRAERNSVAHKERAKQYRQSIAERKAIQRVAWNAVAKAIKEGNLVRPKICSACGKKPPESATRWALIHAHHHKGYDHPLDVVWVCASCHKDIEGYTKRKVSV